MTQTQKIAPPVAFDPGMTNEHVRSAFELLANDPGLLECNTLRNQVLFAKDFLAQQLFQVFSIPNAEIARFFGVRDYVVGDILKRGDNGHEQRGRFPSLSQADLQDLRGWTDTAIQEHDHLTLTDAVEKLERLNNKTITRTLSKKCSQRPALPKRTLPVLKTLDGWQ